jgi:hypothetical protein
LCKECVAEIKFAEIKTCQNLEKLQNLELAGKNTYTVTNKNKKGIGKCAISDDNNI